MTATHEFGNKDLRILLHLNVTLSLSLDKPEERALRGPPGESHQREDGL